MATPLPSKTFHSTKAKILAKHLALLGVCFLLFFASCNRPQSSTQTKPQVLNDSTRKSGDSGSTDSKPQPELNGDELAASNLPDSSWLPLKARPMSNGIALQVTLDNAQPIKFDDLAKIEIDVALKNVRTDGELARLQFGGHYRSGRQTRWRIQVWDSSNELLPIRPGSRGGGLSTTGMLEPGKCWETRLRLLDYVSYLRPGKYKLQVYYHDELEIANYPDPNSLVGLDLAVSELIETTVK